jgi:hypothetical protein
MSENHRRSHRRLGILWRGFGFLLVARAPDGNWRALLQRSGRRTSLR